MFFFNRPREGKSGITKKNTIIDEKWKWKLADEWVSWRLRSASVKIYFVVFFSLFLKFLRKQVDFVKIIEKLKSAPVNGDYLFSNTNV